MDISGMSNTEHEKNQETLKRELSQAKARIVAKCGSLKAFRKFQKGQGPLAFKGFVCPDVETWNLYKKYARICLDLR